MRAFLDTCVLVSGRFTPPSEVTEVAVTSISYAELRFGTAAAGLQAVQRVERSIRLEAIAERFGEGTPFDDRAAVSYGHITDLVLASGRSPRGRLADLMIAAIAHANDAALITMNLKDFAGLERMVKVFPA